MVIRQPIAVSDISIYICLIDIRSKSKEQLNERRAGLSSGADVVAQVFVFDKLTNCQYNPRFLLKKSILSLTCGGVVQSVCTSGAQPS